MSVRADARARPGGIKSHAPSLRTRSCLTTRIFYGTFHGSGGVCISRLSSVAKFTYTCTFSERTRGVLRRSCRRVPALTAASLLSHLEKQECGTANVPCVDRRCRDSVRSKSASGQLVDRPDEVVGSVPCLRPVSAFRNRTCACGVAMTLGFQPFASTARLTRFIVPRAPNMTPCGASCRLSMHRDPLTVVPRGHWSPITRPTFLSVTSRPVGESAAQQRASTCGRRHIRHLDWQSRFCRCGRWSHGARGVRAPPSVDMWCHFEADHLQGRTATRGIRLAAVAHPWARAKSDTRASLC